MNIAGPRSGTWHDFSSGDHGDIVALVMREKQLSFNDAVKWLNEFANSGGAACASNIAPAEPQQRWSKPAERIWRQARPLAGTLAEKYLRSRKCYIPNATDLRFLSGNEGHLPAIVSRVTDFLTGDPLTLHFIRLDQNGDKAEVSFLAKHQKQGGVIRLLALPACRTALGLAEGVETALSVVANCDEVMWAALDAGNLGALPHDPKIKALHIWGDNDRAGRDAATKLADRYVRAGAVARLVFPDDNNADWNDVARGSQNARFS